MWEDVDANVSASSCGDVGSGDCDATGGRPSGTGGSSSADGGSGSGGGSGVSSSRPSGGGATRLELHQRRAVVEGMKSSQRPLLARPTSMR